MAEKRTARGMMWINGPLAARPDAVGLADWFAYLSDEGPIYRVLNGAWKEAAISTADKGFVNHGAVAGTARPAGYASVEWFGTVEPTNAINGDTWNNPT
jgi:hypothetical protein